MFNLKIKKIIDFLFISGLGFATSCIISLNGFRENIETSLLIIGGVLLGTSLILHLIFWRCPNCGKLLSPFCDIEKNNKCSKCKEIIRFK